MTELNCQQLTEYLKYVSSLETSVYKQKEVKKEAKKNLVLNTPEKQMPSPPQKIQEPEMPQPPLTPEESQRRYKASFSTFSKNIIIFCAIGVALALIIYFITYKILGALVPLAIGILIAILNAKKMKAAKKENAHLLISKENYPRLLERYNRDMEEYHGRVADIQERNEIMEADYVKECAESEVLYNERVLAANNAFDIAKTEAAKIDTLLEETQSILNKVYAKDIIFPKYRNMVAMCAIYEYFVSGRCTELGGPAGAYNLYETELRQNIVIDQLNNINNNLEQIKKNQYVLYQCLSETNQAIRDIGSDIRYMCHALDDIAVSSNIAAYCSSITASNTSAMTWMMALS